MRALNGQSGNEGPKGTAFRTMAIEPNLDVTEIEYGFQVFDQR